MKYVNPNTPHTHPVHRPAASRSRMGLPIREKYAGTAGSSSIEDFDSEATVSRAAFGAVAIGAGVLGALAVAAGSVAILAVWRLSIRSARIRDLEVDNLEVKNLHVAGRARNGIEETGGILRFDTGTAPNTGTGAPRHPDSESSASLGAGAIDHFGDME